MATTTLIQKWRGIADELPEWPATIYQLPEW
jgi:hypothetical protein